LAKVSVTALIAEVYIYPNVGYSYYVAGVVFGVEDFGKKE